MCVEKIGVRGRCSFEMLVCMIAHMHGRPCVAEPEKLRSRVRLRLFCDSCVFAANAHMCVAEARSPWSQFCVCVGVSADTRVVAGVNPRDCTHTCVLSKQGTPCQCLLCGCVAKYISVAECWLLSGVIPFDCAHTCVLQKPGIRNWRSQLSFAVLAGVSVYESTYEYTRTCRAGVGKQSAVTVPATATAQTCLPQPKSPLSWVLLR